MGNNYSNNKKRLVMRIRKVFESMTDPDDMFEIFKDIVDDVLLTEFDKELDYEFKKGQIEIMYDGEIYLNPGDDDIYEICQEDNWGFQFTMPDRREDKKRILQRIVDIFEKQTNTKLGFCELGISGKDYVGYRNPIVKIIFSKPEWINWSVNLKDFEEFALDEIDSFISTKYNDIKISQELYGLSLILEVSTGMALIMTLKRKTEYPLNPPTFLNKLEIKDGEMSYDVSYRPSCFYGDCWVPMTEISQKIQISSVERKPFDFSHAGNRNYIDINEFKKNQLIKASEELNSNHDSFKINLNEDQFENAEKLANFLEEVVFPKIQSTTSELINQIEEQIKKLGKEDNIIIDSQIITKYKKNEDEFIVWLCETEYKKQQFIFKITLDVSKSEVIIHSNSDKNNDGSALLTCLVNELSECIFLCLVDNKLQSK